MSRVVSCRRSHHTAVTLHWEHKDFKQLYSLQLLFLPSTHRLQAGLQLPGDVPCFHTHCSLERRQTEQETVHLNQPCYLQHLTPHQKRTSLSPTNEPVPSTRFFQLGCLAASMPLKLAHPKQLLQSAL